MWRLRQRQDRPLAGLQRCQSSVSSVAVEALSSVISRGASDGKADTHPRVVLGKLHDLLRRLCDEAETGGVIVHARAVALHVAQACEPRAQASETGAASDHTGAVR